MMSPSKAKGYRGSSWTVTSFAFYRQDDENSTNIAGLVEIFASDTKRSFNTFYELRMIINEEAAIKSMSDLEKGKDIL